MMRFASLGSGSQGNSLIVEAGNTRIMLDCGFSVKATVSRLETLMLMPEDLSGVIVTHEHNDHACGVFSLAARYDLPVWLTHGTWRAAQRYVPQKGLPDIHFINCFEAFTIGALDIQPYPVPHDAEEPVQFRFQSGDVRLGVLTDAGSVTPHIEAVLQHCHALALECNHDTDMLQNGAYSPALKQRVGGSLGHLSNQDAARLLSKLLHADLHLVVAMHLSEQNNDPALAQSCLASVLENTGVSIKIADQKTGLSWHTVN